MDTIFTRPTLKTRVGDPTLATTPRGFRVDFSPIAGAYDAPQINPRGFIAGELAMGQVGEGLQSLGGSLDKVQEQMADSVNRRMIAEAEIAREKAKASIAAEVAAEKDPLKWPEIAKKAIANAQKMSIPEGASPLARSAIEPDSVRWGISTQSEIEGAARRRTIELEAQTYGAMFQSAMNEKRYPDAMAAIDRGVNAGVIAADVGERMRGVVMASRDAQMIGDYKAGVAQAVMDGDYATKSKLDEAAFANKLLTEEQYKLEQKTNVHGQLVQDIKGQIQADPREALKTISAFNLDDTDRRNLQYLADVTLKQYKNQELRQIADDVTTQKIRHGSEVAFHWIDSPSEQQEVRSDIDAAPLSVDEMVPVVLKLDARIDKLNAGLVNDGEEAATREMLDISTTINRLPSHVRGNYAEKLRARLDGKPSTLKDSYIAEGKAIIAGIFDAEEEKLFKRGDYGVKTLRPGKEKDWANLRLKITEMENNLKAQMPDNPDPTKAWDIIQQVTGQEAAKSRKDAYKAPVPGERWDLPHRPDPSNPEMQMPTIPGLPNPILFRSEP